jgi:hypothetical protein
MNIGSVSHATMRPEDLIPTFVWELENQKNISAAHKTLCEEINERMKQEGYFDSEEAYYDLNEDLFNALNEYALPYFYFGSHPGDGCDYGYWLSENFEDDFDGLKVSDISEVPKDYSGEVLHVNDHGDMTLYNWQGETCTLLWTLA